jgi:hypothetical protein
MPLADCIDLTAKSSLARKTHDGMSATKKVAAGEVIAKTFQTKINKEVENTLLDVAHREKLKTSTANICLAMSFQQLKWCIL